jgi:hypothetical protein
MNLIIVSSLSCDEGLYFRYITMIAKEELGFDVLLEARKEDVDHYFKTLKDHGWFDFVDDFIQSEHREEGVRVDRELNYPKTIQVDKIRCENTLSIIGQVKSLKEKKE